MPKVHNKYHNTAPEGAVYIGRPSPWGNPWTVEESGRDKAVDLFQTWITADEQWSFRERVRKELRGKDLICFCKPKRCHGDILICIANTEEGSYLGWGQYDGPGTDGYCRSYFALQVPPEWPEEQKREVSAILEEYMYPHEVANGAS